MLRAYDYAEKRMDDRIRDAHVLNKEKEIALKFVLEHPISKVHSPCPICGSHHTGYVFDIWNIDYLRCRDCNSIFVPVDDDTMQKYKNLEELKEFRKDRHYQNLIREIRDSAYEENIRWLQYRAYRYLGRNSDIKIIDYGDKYQGFIDKIKGTTMTSEYELRESPLLEENEAVGIDQADIIISMNQLQHEPNPLSLLRDFRKSLSDHGILVLNTRLGSGFDVLTLKGSNDDIYPYEHVLLPSRRGVEMAMEMSGYELLEITTPGTRDINVVKSNVERLGEDNLFVRYLMDTADERMLMDFQQFLQKNGLSSFVRLIARKRAS